MTFKETNSEKSTLSENNNFNPDKRIDVNEMRSANAESDYNPDKRIDVSETKIVKPESNLLSSYKERLDQVPKNDTNRGGWEGERGESKYIPSNAEIKKLLEKYNMDGIEYNNAIPDFSAFSKATVEIDNMTSNRNNNFRQADLLCAEKWSKEGRDGKTDWTPRDVANWRRDNGYSWHECNDTKTCQLIPTKVNDYFGHLGGVGECNKRNPMEVVFDE